ncbi:pyocin knob domain-containing protein [Ochrobactrum sp. Marseille-Q0166]|uniref:pyocin knob domain-containing protein n=1 Tax=Ochrobactrum sp. Marseille-Q0166 TaxID=2761105 RepID=UPI001654C4DF|nr:pyocin knob domain-containing protein [Ochrobactrum sp. Marseille-Q0166]MBC8719320.1 hypothetical protein [Ochrobactrum sp. Marseille-Q0166]
MAVLPDYVSGTITLANGSTNVTGSGTAFQLAAFKSGDTLQIQNLTAVIASVNSDTSLTLTSPWTGTTLTNAVYRARYLPDGARVTAQTTTLIELLGNGNLQSIAGLTGAADKGIYFTGAGTVDTFNLTSYARTLLGRSSGSQVYSDLGTVPEAQIPERIRAAQTNAVTDCNSVQSSGWSYAGGTALNKPTSNVGMLLTLFQISGYGTQIFFDRSNGADTYRRVCNNNVWTNWLRLSANDFTQGFNGDNGWCRLPNDLIIQWGRPIVTLNTGSAGTIVLPTTFPNNHFTHVLSNGDWGVANARAGTFVTFSKANNNIGFACNGVPANGTVRVNFWAVGN